MDASASSLRKTSLANSPDATEVLLQCMQERFEILQALQTLTDSQNASHQQELNVMLGLLARKQILLDGLNNIQQKLSPFFNDDPEQRLWQTRERRELCRKLADEGTRILHIIVQREQTTIEQMSSQRDAVAAQLQEGKNSVLASTAYQTDSLLEASALDISNL